ncbi:MAG TPA: L-fuconate dehydratase [Terriglobales bacterium]|nr:L-fuconate dehydratase [Terriglobales bacterium]
MLITDLALHDVRFPTSSTLAGSDAVHPSPDYSAAYVILKTDSPDGLEGHALSFTAGRGTEVVLAGVLAFRPFVVGRTLEEIVANFRGFWESLVGDGQLRWIGPEKGVIHLAASAVLNAVWDLYAKSQGKPLWKLLLDMKPEDLVSMIEFRYLSDAITPQEALDILEKNYPTRSQREQQMLDEGYPAYTTSVGWLGYTDDKLQQLCAEAIAQGWTHAKMKVGGNLQDDIRRVRLVREALGPERKLMIDANQAWDVPQAIDWIKRLAEFDLWWAEEPTSPDDVRGHATIARSIAPIGVATGEQCQNRVIFKQLFQLEAIRFCQIDACRLASVNEVLAVILMAAKFGVSVCPHAGGVGLCEYVQHYSLFDYIAVSASLENRVLEYIDHLHEHFVHPVEIRCGRYMPPKAPGFTITMRPDSLDAYAFPNGPVWRK